MVQKVFQVIEKGHISFYYRPRIGREVVNSLVDVQRLFLVLNPTHAFEEHGAGQEPPEKVHKSRIIIVGKKRLPSVDSHERGWALVDKTLVHGDVEAELKSELHYHTASGKERVRAPAILSATGIYEIVLHDDKTVCGYTLESPQRLQKMHYEFNILPTATFLISVKNPEKPAAVGLDEDDKWRFSKELQKLFGGRRWSPIYTCKLINHPGIEILLIGCSESLAKEMGPQATLEMMKWHDEEVNAMDWESD